METQLKVKGRIVKGYEYFRVFIPSDVSKELNLENGDKLDVNIIRVLKKGDADYEC